MTRGDAQGERGGFVSSHEPLVGYSRSVLFAVDSFGTVEYVSLSITRRLGFDQETLVSEPLTMVVHPSDRETVEDVLSRAMESTVALEGIRLLNVNGNPVTVTLVSERAPESVGASVVVEAIVSPEETEGTEDERELARYASSLAAIHETSTEMYAAKSVEACAEIVIDAAVDVLGLEWSILASESEGGGFTIEAVSDDVPLSVGEPLLSVEKGTARHVSRTKRGEVTEYSRGITRSQLSTQRFRSSVTVPIGDWGVFQALSRTPNAFDEADMRLAELLVRPMATIVERIEDETELRRRRAELERLCDRIERLHDVSSEMIALSSRQAIYEFTVSVVEDILAFDTCVIDEVEDGAFVRKAAGSGLSIEAFEPVPIDRGGTLAGATLRDGEAVVVDELNGAAYTASLGGNRSAVSVPLGEYGVLQAASRAPNAIDENDRRLVELLAEHLVGVVDRVEQVRDLERRVTDLERQNDRLEEFSSFVSHDLRTPLSVASGYLELVRESTEHEALDEVNHALMRMEGLIDDSLTMAKSGSEVVDPSPVSIATVARRRWQEVARVDAFLVITNDLPKTVLADERRVNRIFENLFRNAIEHGGGNVMVRVGGLDDGGFYVEDDGPGIPEERREQVLEYGHSGTDGGSGLGLAIVAEIAAAHGWDLTVTESWAGGARFEFRV